MGAPGDTSLVGHYDMGSGLHLAARCSIEQIQNYSPLVLTIFAEKYLQAHPIENHQNFYSLSESLHRRLFMCALLTPELLQAPIPQPRNYQERYRNA
eukprot:5595604-Pleurochrysis_carterae.AAC.1